MPQMERRKNVGQIPSGELQGMDNIYFQSAKSQVYVNTFPWNK